MPSLLSTWYHSLQHLVFPHLCEGCGTNLLSNDELLCTQCLHQLPISGFTNSVQNPMANQFAGRIPIQHATAAFFFTKQSLLQHLMVELKYRNNPQVGKYLGKQLGKQIMHNPLFNDIDVLIPLPLNSHKKAIRGYNQAEVICNGIAEVWNKPVNNSAVIRKVFTDSQTTHSRVERWQNMEGVFAVKHPNELENKHIALVDDVVTTGSTIEACGLVILQIPGTKLSVLSVAFTV